MARPAKVWYRADIGWWMITLGGEKTRLVQGPNDDHHRELAEEKYVELRKLRRLTPDAVNARTADIAEAFLKHSRLHFAADTHRVNKYYVQILAESCGLILARDIKPHHIQRMIDERVDPGRERKPKERAWGETTIYNARKAAYRVFSWAAEQKLLPENPLAGMKRPKPRPRQRAITEAEFKQLYDNAGGPLKDLLLALYMTGARPKEVRDLKWEHVREDRWVLPEHKTAKSTGRPRVIFLNDDMKAVMARLRGNGHEYVFLNTEDQPWTRNALRLQVWRIKTKLKMPKDVCAYLCRHGFGTRAILSGVSGPTLAELMGHTSQDMISKVYVHLADQHQHLQRAVNSISGLSTLAPDASHPVRKRAKPGPNAKKPGRKPRASEAPPRT